MDLSIGSTPQPGTCSNPRPDAGPGVIGLHREDRQPDRVPRSWKSMSSSRDDAGRHLLILSHVPTGSAFASSTLSAVSRTILMDVGRHPIYLVASVLLGDRRAVTTRATETSGCLLCTQVSRHLPNGGRFSVLGVSPSQSHMRRPPDQ